MSPPDPSRSAAGCAALLIDLENFFLAREERSYFSGEEVYGLADDLDRLIRYVDVLGQGRRRAVSRAYANYSASRPGDSERRWDYYLQGAPKTMMERGVEPVQVFRFPGGGSKNAADMRLAMDAIALIRENPRIEQVALVSGDGDFVPMILELRKVGVEVVVIGVREHTKAVLERYCDRFEYFEDLVAAEENGVGRQAHFQQARRALHRVLAGRRGLRLDAVKPLLHGELGHSLDCGRFDCESVVEFIETHADELGVELEHGEEVTIALAAGAGQVDADEDPADGGGGNGAVPADNSTAAIDEAAPERGERTVVLRPHSAYLYRQLLRKKVPKIYVVPWSDWTFVMETVFSMVVADDGARRVVLHRNLREDLIRFCDGNGMDNAEKKVDATLFQLFKARCFVCTEPGPDEGRGDFHWRKPARLDEALDTIEALRDRVRLFVIDELRERLTATGLSTEIDVAVLSAELDGFDAPPEVVEHLGELVERQPAQQAVAPAR
jgi:uncharacterized LabA/DUF88 family protein